MTPHRDIVPGDGSEAMEAMIAVHIIGTPCASCGLPISDADYERCVDCGAAYCSDCGLSDWCECADDDFDEDEDEDEDEDHYIDLELEEQNEALIDALIAVGRDIASAATRLSQPNAHRYLVKASERIQDKLLEAGYGQMANELRAALARRPEVSDQA